MPIVSTLTDGMQDVILDGVTGYLSDDDDILAEKLYQITSDSDLREKLSRETLVKSSEINDIDKFIAEIVEKYRTVVK